LATSRSLGELWRKLGVHAHGGDVRFDDEAPLAALRTAITQPGTALASAARRSTKGAGDRRPVAYICK
jgi:hypothetical protein